MKNSHNEMVFNRSIKINLKNELVEFVRNLLRNPAASIIMFYLVRKSDKYNKCEVKIKKIAIDLDYSERYIQQNINFLKKYNYIKIKKEGRRNIYIINPELVWKSTTKNREKCEWYIL